MRTLAYPWRAVAASFLAVLAGTAAPAIVFGGFAAWERPSPGEFLPAAAIAFLVAGVFTAGTWLFVYLPLYLLMPRSGWFWRWPWATLLGAFTGVAVLGALNLLMGGSFPWFMMAAAGLAGGVTGLVGALLAPRLIPP